MVGPVKHMEYQPIGRASLSCGVLRFNECATKGRDKKPSGEPGSLLREMAVLPGYHHFLQYLARQPIHPDLAPTESLSGRCK